MLWSTLECFLHLSRFTFRRRAASRMYATISAACEAEVHLGSVTWESTLPAPPTRMSFPAPPLRPTFRLSSVLVPPIDIWLAPVFVSVRPSPLMPPENLKVAVPEPVTEAEVAQVVAKAGTTAEQ